MSFKPVLTVMIWRTQWVKEIKDALQVNFDQKLTNNCGQVDKNIIVLSSREDFDIIVKPATTGTGRTI